MEEGEVARLYSHCSVLGAVSGGLGDLKDVLRGIWASVNLPEEKAMVEEKVMVETGERH